MKTQISGTVRGVFVSCQQDSIISEPRGKLDLTFEGVVGDKHYGATKQSDSRTPYYTRGTIIRNYRQVAIVSTEELSEIAGHLGIPSILPEWLGTNIQLEGIPQLTFLPPSTRLFFPNDAVLVVNGENNPCHLTARMTQSYYSEIQGIESEFVKAATHLRGVVAWVERPGVIFPGDEVLARLPSQRIYSIA